MKTAHIAALRIGTPSAVRAWAKAYGVPLLPCSDDVLILSIHEARLFTKELNTTTRITSWEYLKGRSGIPAIGETYQHAITKKKVVVRDANTAVKVCDPQWSIVHA